MRPIAAVLTVVALAAVLVPVPVPRAILAVSRCRGAAGRAAG